MAINIKKEFGNSRERKPDITSMVYGKVPPQAPEMEEAVLGVLLIEKDKLDIVLDILPNAEFFYVDAHQKIFEAIIRLYRNGAMVDLLTVTEELRKANELEIIGGAYYLTRLTMNVVSGAHIEDHCRLIAEKYMAREVIRISGQAINNAYNDDTDVFDLLDFTEGALSELHQSIGRKEVQHIGKLSKDVTQEVTELRESKQEFTGVPTGFDELDRKLGGWQKTHLIILAARPAVGKTSFVLNVGINAATHPIKPTPTAIFSLEMGYTDLIKRVQSANTGVKLEHINHPLKMIDSEFQTYLGSDKALFTVPVFIDDKAYLSIQELRVKARKLKNKQNIGLIIIDYLQLMQGSKNAGNREQEISKISRDLKTLAKELDIPIIALSQLNRDVEKRAIKKPTLADLRESGAIEQDADEVILMYRPGNDEEKDMSLQAKGSVEFNIAKNRHGDTGEVILFFEREIQKWHSSNPYLFSQQFQEPTNHHKSFQHLNTYQPGEFRKIENNNSQPDTKDDLPF